MTKTTNKSQVADVAHHDNDTGSTEVQITRLTERINYLSEHLKTHNKDKHSRRGLLQVVANRRKLIAYLQRTNREAFNKLAETLGLKNNN